MREPTWVSKRAVLAAHGEQLAQHGGSDGLRDEGLLDSALAKPMNVFACESDVDLFRLAASYAFGIARNDAFIDGNKRTALMVCLLFLARNGWWVRAEKQQLYLTFLGLAEGTVNEVELAEWLRGHASAA